MTPTEEGTTLTETWELLQPEVFIKAMGADYPTQRAALIEADLPATLSNLKSSIESAGSTTTDSEDLSRKTHVRWRS
jgi:hypothetical protein